MSESAVASARGAGPGSIPPALRPSRRRHRPNLTLAILLLPAVIIAGSFIVYPLVTSVLQSLHASRS
jgi:ABC-type sugar transport system permease subunit